jgi:uroporphyrinogen-III synthase
MTPRVVTIRPEPGCSATAGLARDFGLTIECYPLFEVAPVACAVPDGEFDGLLAGSANAFRHGGLLVDNFVEKPVYAVGESTAAAAWERGFRIAAIGTGGLQSVLDGLAGRRIRLLRIFVVVHIKRFLSVTHG